MSEEYKLGNFTFQSEEDYKNALRELKIIQEIKQKYNIDSPDTARLLLSKISRGLVPANTQIGKAFENYLHNVIEKNKTDVPLNNLKNVKIEYIKRSNNTWKHVCFIVILIILFLAGWWYFFIL